MTRRYITPQGFGVHVIILRLISPTLLLQTEAILNFLTHSNFGANRSLVGITSLIEVFISQIQMVMVEVMFENVLRRDWLTNSIL